MLQLFVSNLLSYVRREDEEGQTLVEYALLLALIAIVVIAALLILGPIVRDIFSDVGDTLGGTN
jgi:pilus assembly protein Flp/PilA